MFLGKWFTAPLARNFPYAYVSNLLDLAIYSFGSQSSLRSHHKVRGDPVLEGVSVILGRMVLTSNPETKAAFEEKTPARLGN